MSGELPANRLIRTEIAGVPVVDLAGQFGTPTYIYDAATVEARIASLRSFDVIRYAQKACSNLAILDLMRRHDVLVDAVSAGEIERALAVGYRPGAAPPEIVYTADIFDEDALRMVVERNIAVNVGSPDMIDQLGNVAPGAILRCASTPDLGTA